MERVTLRTSAILVSTGERTEWFDTKEDLPAALRERLEDTLNSSNSFTYLLADRNGRQELANAVGGGPSPVRGLGKEAGGVGGTAVATIVERAGDAGKGRNEGIGIVPKVKRLIIGFGLAFSAVLFLLTAKILSR